MDSNSKASTDFPPTVGDPDPNAEIILLIQPGATQQFEFFHTSCLRKDQAAQRRVRFTVFQALDAVKIHGLSPICPGCGRNLISHPTAEPHY